MPPLEPLKQTVFEEGPKTSVGTGAMPVLQFQENPTVIPGPINPAVAVDPGVAWANLGQYAIDTAGKMYEETLNYVIEGKDASLQALGYALQDKTDDKYQHFQLMLAEAQASGSSLSVDVLKQYEDSLRTIKEDYVKGASSILGPEAFERYTKGSPDLRDMGSAYRRLALQTRKSFYDIENNATQNLIASANSLRTHYNNQTSQQKEMEKLVGYLETGSSVSEDSLNEFRSSVTVLNEKKEAVAFDPHAPSQDVTETEYGNGLAEYARRSVPSNGVGTPLSGVKEEALRVFSPNSSEPDRQIGLAIIQAASDEQVEKMGANDEDRIRLQMAKVLLHGMSIADASRFLQQTRDTSAIPIIANQRQALPKPGIGTTSQLKSLTDTTASVLSVFKERWKKQAAASPSISETTERRTSPPTDDVLTQSQYYQSVVAGAFALGLSLEGHKDKEAMVSAWINTRVNSPYLHVTRDGSLTYVPYVPETSPATKELLLTYNSGMLPDYQLSENTLAARTNLSKPITLTDQSITHLTKAHTYSMDTALRFSRTAFPVSDVVEIAYSLRNLDKNVHGATITGGASEAEILRVTVITSDEVLRYYNHELFGRYEVPPDSGIVITNSNGVLQTVNAREYVLRTAAANIPNADRWGMDIVPQQGKFIISFDNIPFKKKDGTIGNLLKESTIVPSDAMFSDSLVLLDQNGRFPSLVVEHMQGDQQGSVDLTQEAKDMHAYLENLTRKEPMSTSSTANVTVDDRDLIEVAGKWFKHTEASIKPHTDSLGPLYMERMGMSGPRTDDTLPKTDRYRTPAKQFLSNPSLRALLFNEEEGSYLPVDSFPHFTNTMFAPTMKAALAQLIQEHTQVSSAHAEDMLDDLFSADFPVGKEKESLAHVLYRRHKGQPIMYAAVDIVNIIQEYLAVDPYISAIGGSLPSQTNTKANMMATRETASSWGLPPARDIGINSLEIDSLRKPNRSFGFGTNEDGWVGLGVGGQDKPSPRGYTPFTTGFPNINTEVDYYRRHDKGPNNRYYPGSFGIEVGAEETGDDAIIQSLGISRGEIRNYFVKEGVLDVPSTQEQTGPGPNTYTPPELLVPEEEVPLLPVPASIKQQIGDYLFKTSPMGPRTEKAQVSPGVMGRQTVKADLEDASIKITSQNFPPNWNKDGTIVSVLTTVYQETPDSPFIVIPAISGGKVLNTKAAIELYQKTKQHFGVFSSREKADTFTKELLVAEKTKVLQSEKLWFDFIGGGEGVRRFAYQDQRKVWTIGKGNTTHPDGRPVKKGDVISLEQVDQYMRHFVYTKVLPNLRKIPLWDEMTPNQQTALISFAYNTGENFYKAKNFETITAALASKATWKDVPAALPLYNKVYNPDTKKKEVSKGLINRRAAEVKLWLQSDGVNKEKTGENQSVFKSRDDNTEASDLSLPDISSIGKEIVATARQQLKTEGASRGDVDNTVIFEKFTYTLEGNNSFVDVMTKIYGPELTQTKIEEAREYRKQPGMEESLKEYGSELPSLTKESIETPHATYRGKDDEDSFFYGAYLNKDDLVLMKSIADISSLLHELTHANQATNTVKRNVSPFWKEAFKDEQNDPKEDNKYYNSDLRYVLDNFELPAHLTAMKAIYYLTTGKTISNKSTDQEVAQMFKTVAEDPKKQSVYYERIYNIFKQDVKYRKAMTDILKAIAVNIKDTGERIA